MARPKRTTIKGQKHELAYINKDEKRLLRSRGGGVTKNGGQLRGPGDIPAYGYGHGGGNVSAPFGGTSGIGGAVGQTGAGSGDTSSFGGHAPSSKGPFGFTYGENVTASLAQAAADAGHGQGGAPNWLTSGQIRLDQDINPIPKGDLSGTNLSSKSTEDVAQPLASADEAEARRRARSGFGGSGILERIPQGLTG